MWIREMVNIFRWRRAQKYEVAFWESIRHHGYEGYSFDEWKELNRKNKLAIINKIGKPLEFYLNKVVVEIGCGPRGVIAFLSAKERIGIEPAISKYQELYGDLIDKEVRYLSKKAENIGLPNQYADVIFCWNCLDHTQNPQAVLQEARRILNPSGFMSFQVNLVKDPLGRSRADKVLHPWAFDEPMIVEMLKKTGFIVSYEILKVNDSVHELSFEAICQ